MILLPPRHGEPDPHWGSVVFCSNFGGLDASTEMRDEKGLAWAANGVAQIDTSRTLFGASTALLNGTTSYWASANSASYDIGSNPFTIEAWVYPTGDPSPETTVLGKWGPSDYSFFFGRSTGGSGRKIAFYKNTSNVGSFHAGNTTIVANVWTFISVSKLAGGTTYFHHNGVQDGSFSVSSIDSTAMSQCVGGLSSGAFFGGSIGPCRMTIGVARYGSGNYTPPKGPFPTFGP